VAKTNAALKEQGLTRALQGGQALTGLDQYLTGRKGDLAGLLEKAGLAQQTNTQQKLDAAYQEFLRGSLSAKDLQALLNNAINGSPMAGNTTSNATTSQPDNSGYAMLGALGGTALKAFI
jgi:hypothetical protein